MKARVQDKLGLCQTRIEHEPVNWLRLGKDEQPRSGWSKVWELLDSGVVWGGLQIRSTRCNSPPILQACVPNSRQQAFQYQIPPGSTTNQDKFTMFDYIWCSALTQALHVQLADIHLLHFQRLLLQSTSTRIRAAYSCGSLQLQLLMIWLVCSPCHMFSRS